MTTKLFQKFHFNVDLEAAVIGILVPHSVNLTELRIFLISPTTAKVILGMLPSALYLCWDKTGQSHRKWVIVFFLPSAKQPQHKLLNGKPIWLCVRYDPSDIPNSSLVLCSLYYDLVFLETLDVKPFCIWCWPVWNQQLALKSAAPSAISLGVDFCREPMTYRMQ